jgi:hypothetical protein
MGDANPSVEVAFRFRNRRHALHLPSQNGYNSHCSTFGQERAFRKRTIRKYVFGYVNLWTDQKTNSALDFRP